MKPFKHDEVDSFEVFPYEYFCWSCGQLRLCLDPHNLNRCKNCHSHNIQKAEPGMLDRDELKRQFKRLNDYNEGS